MISNSWRTGQQIGQSGRVRGSQRAATQERLIDEVLATQTALLRALHDRPVPAWLSLDLTIGELKALFLLFHAGPTPIGRLGATLGLGRPAASHLVDALVQHGLVERREDLSDRRRTLAQLAPTAQTLMGEQLTGDRERFAGWLRQLGPDDLASLTRGLRALAAVVADRQVVANDGCP
jgi:DNA-binding MarR family transcriptional regulator